MMYVRYPLSAQRRGSAGRARDRHQPRDRAVLVEPVWPDVRRRDRQERVARMHGYPQWRWHLDEVFVKVNGKLCYLWRAVDHEGEVLEAVLTAKRDKPAALKLLKRIMKRYRQPRSVVTDGLHAYSAPMDEIGAADRRPASTQRVPFRVLRPRRLPRASRHGRTDLVGRDDGAGRSPGLSCRRGAAPALTSPAIVPGGRVKRLWPPSGSASNR